VHDLDALYSELKENYAINTEVCTSFYGVREFTITDVDGYVLTFAENKEV